MEIKGAIQTLREELNKYLHDYMEGKGSYNKRVYEAMQYSLDAGGKRIRPLLFLLTYKLYKADCSEVMDIAAAIEMIHTYSLIHDDLPAMDNDDYRRGRLTNHKVFGEAKAILAGDALLNYAFEYMLECALDIKSVKNYNLEANVKAISYIAKAAGVNGMIGGQVIDIESEGIQVTNEHLEYMHKHKTGALIRAAVMIPAILSESDDEKKKALEKYSANIGLAFQVKDDILDSEGDFKLMGKGIGKDANVGKSTFVSFYGINTSLEILRKLIQDALDSLQIFGAKACFLKGLAAYIAEREN